MLAELAADARVTRVRPARLSLDAVASMAGPRGVLGEELHDRTAGNPFFVSMDAGAVSFRHELARLAVEDSIPPRRREALHQRALTALADRAQGAPDPARQAHHADALGDASLVLEFAPPAAAEASRLGVHREAAGHVSAILGKLNVANRVQAVTEALRLGITAPRPPTAPSA